MCGLTGDGHVQPNGDHLATDDEPVDAGHKGPEERAILVECKGTTVGQTYPKGDSIGNARVFQLGVRMDRTRTIIEGLQDIVSVLEDHLKPLVEAELSVLVDILYRPELLFPSGTDSRQKCENGGFIRYARSTQCPRRTSRGNICSIVKIIHRRLISHTSKLLEEKQEVLCIKILQTLREMMAVDPEFGEKVS